MKTYSFTNGNYRLSSTSLARCLLKHPEQLLKGFSQVKNDKNSKKPPYSIAFEGSTDRGDVEKAYNELIRKLIPYVGEPEISYEQLRNALFRALDWQGKSLDDLPDFEADAILRVASKIKIRITFQMIKAELPQFDLKTRKIEEVLLTNGWVMTTEGRHKYFKKPSYTL
jgi:hypothetical protein